jgi:hypothetical protein
LSAYGIDVTVAPLMTDTYVEERTFSLGRFMTGYSSLQPGALSVPEDAGPVAVIQAMAAQMYTCRQKD